MLNVLQINEPIRDIGPLLALTNNPSNKEMSVMAKANVSKPQLICQAKGCNNPRSVRSFCRKHYESLRRKGAFSDRTCKMDDCGGFPYAFGLCRKHYQRRRDLGSEYARSKNDQNKITVRGDICEIQLYNRKNQPTVKTVIDVGDKWKVDGFKWSLSHGNTSFYVSRDRKFTPRLLHNLILDSPEGFDVDHSNGNTLDNRKSNLRVATRGQNNANSKFLRKTNTSGYRGVCWSKQKSKYIGQIQYDGVHQYLGCAGDPDVMAKIYDAAAIKLFGEFAVTNKDLGLL